jgi:transcriptional regulator with XRE-family HTH domain
MTNNIKKHIKPLRLNGLPEDMRTSLVAARHHRGWSQAELGRRLGLPQMHVSGIETGRVVPRFDTLLDFVRVLGYDLLLTPRSLVPAVQALIRDEGQGMVEQPLYANHEEQENPRSGRDEIS